MEDIVTVIIQQYGIYGVLLVALAMLGYLIWGDRKNNWGTKIDSVLNKIEGVEIKMEYVKNQLSSRIEHIENNIQSGSISNERQEAKEQSLTIISTGYGGKLAKSLKHYCRAINCDHIFLGAFHNGTVDLRGIHFCKFDILIDEFRDPLRLYETDVDFQSLYKDENILAYGDLPYALTHVESAVFNLDQDTLLDLSDTLYRRCKSRGVKTIAFACVRDQQNNPVGFVGCVNFTDDNIDESQLRNCVKEIENIYNEKLIQ